MGEQLSFPEPGTELPAPDDAGTPEPPPEPDLSTQLLAAQEREAAANRALEAERSRLDRLLAQPTPQPTPSVQDEPLGAMPDPTESPQEFGQWLERRDRRNQAALVQRTEEVRTQVTEANRGEHLWLQFTARYPEYANLRELAGVAWNKVQSGSYADDSELLGAVKTEMDRMTNGKLAGDPGAPPSRTRGVSGGSPPAVPPSKKAPPSQDGETSSLGDEILSWQQEQGYI